MSKQVLDQKYQNNKKKTRQMQGKSVCAKIRQIATLKSKIKQ